MRNIENKVTKEKILKLITLLENPETPEFMKKAYTIEAGINLMRYSGKDYNELFKKYSVVKK